MDDSDFRVTRELIQDWDKALGAVLDAVQKSKKALIFQDAAFLETTAKRALWALQKLQEGQSAAQTG